LVRHRDLAEPRADVDMTLRSQRLKIGLHPRILGERLQERADGVLHHRPHFFFELGELRGRETLVKPGVVCFEVELRVADEKIRLAVTAKRREPTIGALEVALDSVDIGRLRRDHAPAEHTNALALRHGPAALYPSLPGN